MAALALCGACVGDGDGGSLYSCDGRAPPGGDGTGAAAVEVLSPGGDQYLAGDPVIITWRTEGGIDNVDIDLLRGGEPVLAIARNVEDAGAYEWAAPFALAPGDDLRIRVADSAGRAAADGGAFAVANWEHVRSVVVTSHSAQSLTDFQVPIDLAPGTFDFSGAHPAGADVRFASRVDRPDGHDVDFYIERWSAGGARVWVRVPVLPAGGDATIHMFYGAPTADSASDIDAVFPRRFSSSGSAVLDGEQQYDWFELNAGHTLTVGPSEAVTVRARVIRIAGVIDGAGAGYPGGAIGFAGAGPGAGGISSSGGGGGGGYGGEGGIGGFYFGYLPGSGGDEHGTSDGPDIDAGSGGGGSLYVQGGTGGAAVTLVAHTVTVDGAIGVEGAAGESCQYADCGGGGAGGGILLSAHDLEIGGALTARGGAGGDGESYADFGGGGGGGGRVKLRFSGSLALQGSIDVDGGDGGYGGLGGDSGEDGTLFSGQVPRTEPTAVVGAETPVFP